MFFNMIVFYTCYGLLSSQDNINKEFQRKHPNITERHLLVAPDHNKKLGVAYQV